MISTIYILIKKEDDWYVLRCYEKNENRYEIVWSYNGSKNAVIYEFSTCIKDAKMIKEILHILKTY
jgi:hypothetical protein